MTQTADADIREIKTAIESIAKATEANSKAVVDLTQEMRTGFSNVDTRFTKLDGRIDTLETRVLGKFDTVNARLTNLESNTKAVADLAEKIGEFKNWKQIAFVMFSAVIGGVIGYFVKGGKI
jgi:chromosome segregation ATPase